MGGRIKVDLHTHSIASPDGGLRAHEYIAMLETGPLGCIAITDHNTIEFAVKMHAKLGNKIIVGEEIMTTQGEIVGLYLKASVASGMTPEKTVKSIKDQGGLVYIPHPFETVRSGLSTGALKKIIDDVDIIEVGNGRAVFQNRSELAKEWAVLHQKAPAVSSDAHGVKEWGRTYDELDGMPTKGSLVKLLHQSRPQMQWPGAMGLLYPKLNRLQKKLLNNQGSDDA